MNFHWKLHVRLLSCVQVEIWSNSSRCVTKVFIDLIDQYMLRFLTVEKSVRDLTSAVSWSENILILCVFVLEHVRTESLLSNTHSLGVGLTHSSRSQLIEMMCCSEWRL